MKRSKQNSDLKKNHELKINLIKEIKSLLDSSSDNDTKYENFLGLRKKWINIGKRLITRYVLKLFKINKKASFT